MNLLDINPSPLYDVVVPSTKKKIKFRPFVVKEERALLAAEASEDPVVMMETDYDVQIIIVKFISADALVYPG